MLDFVKIIIVTVMFVVMLHLIIIPIINKIFLFIDDLKKRKREQKRIDKLLDGEF